MKRHYLGVACDVGEVLKKVMLGILCVLGISGYARATSSIEYRP